MRMLRWGFLILIFAATTLSAGQRAKLLKVEKEGVYSATTRYPWFEGQTAVVRLANKDLSSWAKRRQDKFVKQSSKTLKQSGKPTANYEYTVDYEVTYADSQRLLSIRFDTFQYTGGAHGMPEFVTYSFGMVKGKARRLKLGDFFKAGSAYTDTVTAAILGKLKRNPQAILVVNGEVTSLTQNQLNRFSVEADGLTFLFNPDEVGPYTSGRFQIKLGIDDLGADFTKELLAP